VRQAVVAVTDVYVRTGGGSGSSDPGSSHVRLVARRSQTRRLAALAQRRREASGYG
jgi:hypothetical protein